MGDLTSRRAFISQTTTLTLGLGVVGLPACASKAINAEEVGSAGDGELFFKISLAEWSFHRSIRTGRLTNLDFPEKAKSGFGIDAVEYVNEFFKDKAEDRDYLKDLRSRCEDNGVKNLLIMIDNEGDLGNPEESKRLEAVHNHFKWVKAANFLGCHSIRVNAHGGGSRESVQIAAIDGLGRLSEFARDHTINVIVENHGGYSSDGQWLAKVIQEVDLSNCGTLPDFGNFCVQPGPDGCAISYDRYKGVEELMPFAKGVSAKSHEFDEEGNEINTDYTRMLQIVKDSGYREYIGIEYEGLDPDEDKGIKKTLELLIKTGGAL